MLVMLTPGSVTVSTYFPQWDRASVRDVTQIVDLDTGEVVYGELD